MILRWNIDLGLVTIPKSSNPERIRENLAVFDFTLTPEQIAAISALDQGSRRPSTPTRSATDRTPRRCLGVLRGPRPTPSTSLDASGEAAAQTPLRP